MTAAVNAAGRITRVVEKEVVLEHATVGSNFARGADFVWAADRMIAGNRRVNGEFYVAPAYNELVAAGRTIVPWNVGRVGAGMHGLGTRRISKRSWRTLRRRSRHGRPRNSGRAVNAQRRPTPGDDTNHGPPRGPAG